MQSEEPLPPSSELETYAHRLRFVLEKLARAAEELPPDRIDTKVLPEGNSPAALTAHVVASVRGYAIGIGTARPEITRDRPAEFTTAGGTPASLAADYRALADEIDDALARLDPARLDETLVPDQAVFGQGEPEEMSRRQAIVAAIGHAAEHLGELQFIKDLARDG